MNLAQVGAFLKANFGDYIGHEITLLANLEGDLYFDLDEQTTKGVRKAILAIGEKQLTNGQSVSFFRKSFIHSQIDTLAINEEANWLLISPFDFTSALSRLESISFAEIRDSYMFLFGQKALSKDIQAKTQNKDYFLGKLIGVKISDYLNKICEIISSHKDDVVHGNLIWENILVNNQKAKFFNSQPFLSSKLYDFAMLFVAPKAGFNMSRREILERKIGVSLEDNTDYKYFLLYAAILTVIQTQKRWLSFGKRNIHELVYAINTLERINLKVDRNSDIDQFVVDVKEVT